MKVHTTSYGLPRHENAVSDDTFCVKVWDETVIAVLADGAGAARDGKEASTRIVESIINNYAARPSSWRAPRALAEFASLINRTLYQESLTRYDAPELVSTVCAVIVEGNRLFGLNVGDSRVYLARNGRLVRLSEDHVYPELNHVLSRAIGLAPEVDLHTFETELQDGDIAFLCSDGISKIVSEEELATRLTPRVTARKIVQHGHELVAHEAPDDMSAIVIEIAQTGKLQAESQVPLPIPETLQKGHEIDDYELVRCFNHSDRVWLATKNGQRWTLKFPPTEARTNEAILHQFVKETWNATRLRSSYFVEAFVPETPSARYYVMEFVEAPSLKMFLRSRLIAVDEAVALGRFLTKAEIYLLGNGMAHGDIKPENILVLNEYDRLQFKLIDLGSAADIFSVTSRAGTASYLAPERFHGAPLSERTEIYAIGITLYQSLTGRFPYGEIERFQTPSFGVAKPPSQLNPNVPTWLDAVILRSIATSPERRYQHYSELNFDLSNPDKVEPYFQADTSLLERNPLLFYKTGFWVFLATTIHLLLRVISQ